MGTEPLSGTALGTILTKNIPTVQYGQERVVCIKRGHTGKFGFTFRTIKIQKRSITLVKHVKEECCFLQGYLHEHDQILKIDNFPITHSNEEEVYDILKQINSNVLKLNVLSISNLGPIASVKRETLSQNLSEQSSGSSLEHSAFIMPGQNKRNAHTYGSTAEHVHHNSFTYPEFTLPEVPDHVQPSSFHSFDTFTNTDYIHGDRVQSLPVDNICLQDIAVKVDQHQSLPLSLSQVRGSNSPKPIGRTSSTGLNTRSISTTLEEARSNKLDIKPCQNAYCDNKTCSWHAVIFKYPQFVIWEPQTRTVKLEKGSSPTFQFHYKVKVGSNTDQGEVFSLVSQVNPEGPAKGCLQVGDWIRSINKIALEIPKKAYNYDFNKFNSLQLIIQRPNGISAKAANYICNLQSPLHPNHPPPPARSISMQTTSPQANNAALKACSSGSSNQLFRGRTTMQQRNNGEDNFLRPAERKHNSSSDSAFDSLPSSPLSPDDNNLVPQLSSTSCYSLDSEHHFNKCRVIVCGKMANEMAQYLLSGVGGFDPSLDNYVNFLQVLLRKHEDGSVKFQEGQPKMLLRDSASNHFLTGLFGSSGDGQGSLPTSPLLNIELYVIPDESFFHLCCQWICTDNCIFLIAFDAKKLLNSASSEINQLGNLLHTIRATAGEEASIMVYGVLKNDINSVDCSTGVDEVRTLFYTSHGHHLKQYSMPIPEVILLSDSPTTCNTSGLEHLRTILYELAVSVATRFLVSPVTSKLHNVAFLDSGRFGVGRRSLLMNSLRSHAPHLTEYACRQAVADLVHVGDLIPLPPMNEMSGQVSGDGTDEMIIPQVFMRFLRQILIEQSQKVRSIQSNDIWFKLVTTATIAHGDLIILLQDTFADVDGMDVFVANLIRARVIFPLSCDVMDREYLLPYFLEDNGQGTEDILVTEKTSLDLFIAFTEHVSWPLFFQMATAIGRLPGYGKARFSSLCVCNVQWREIDFVFHFDKKADRLHLVIKRNNSSVREAAIFRMLKDVFMQVVPSNVDYILGPACPRNICISSTWHILNLRKVPAYCGSVRMDTQPQIKGWLNSERETSTDLKQDERAKLGSTVTMGMSLPTGNDVHSTSVLKLQSSGNNNTSSGISSSQPKQFQNSQQCMTVSRSESVKDMSVLKLPYSLLHEIGLRLMMQHPTAGDWKVLAGYLGKTSEQVMLFNAITRDNHGLEFLKEWGQNDQGTVGQLREALVKMDRKDVLGKLSIYLNNIDSAEDTDKTNSNT